jgi:hypothetical protein
LITKTNAQTIGNYKRTTLSVDGAPADCCVPDGASDKPFIAYPHVKGWSVSAEYDPIDDRQIRCKLTIARSATAEPRFYLYFCSTQVSDLNLVACDGGRLLDKLTPVRYCGPSLFPRHDPLNDQFYDDAGAQPKGLNAGSNLQNPQWLGIDRTYWISAIKIFAQDSTFQTKPISISIPGYEGGLHGWQVCLQCLDRLQPGETTEVAITLLLMPKTVDGLATVKHDFTRIDWTLRLGIFGAFFKPLAELIAYLADIAFAPGLLGHALLLCLLVARILLACFVAPPDPRALESSSTQQALASTRSAFLHIIAQLLMTYIAYVFTSGLVEMTHERFGWLENLSEPDNSNALSIVWASPVPFFSITTCLCVLFACLNQLYECIRYNRSILDQRNLILPCLMLLSQYTRAIFGLIFIINTSVVVCAGLLGYCSRFAKNISRSS